MIAEDCQVIESQFAGTIIVTKTKLKTKEYQKMSNNSIKAVVE